jgi:hypothetical protein
LWVEHPFYSQAIFALDRLKSLAPQYPEWQNQEPFKSILEGNQDAIAKLTEGDLVQIVAATHAGMTTEEFIKIAKEWQATATHPRFQKLYTELVYQPMREVLQYLQANGFKTYIVTGGGQEFVRIYSDRVYDIPIEQVIGSSIATKYDDQDGKPVLMREPKVFFINDHAGKPTGINLFIGKRPALPVLIRGLILPLTHDPRRSQSSQRKPPPDPHRPHRSCRLGNERAGSAPFSARTQGQWFG